MIDKQLALTIAENLIDAWNRKCLPVILAHYHEDVVATNPLFSQLLGVKDGVIQGKEALSPFWSKVLEQLPHLNFKLLDVYLGVDNFVIRYVGMFGKNVVEVFTVDKDCRVVATVTYLDSLNLP